MTARLDALTDLTLLQEEASFSQIELLIEQAEKRAVAGICVYPQHLAYLPNSVRRVTVVNFPSGNDEISQILDILNEVFLNNWVDEVDYVFPYQTFLKGDLSDAFAHYRAIAKMCKSQDCLLKVILETGAFSSMSLLRDLAMRLIGEGCQFLKTSTGKIQTGATLEAVRVLLETIREENVPCGIKVSGGIRTDEQATAYLELAEDILQRKADLSWFRIGRSLALSTD